MPAFDGKKQKQMVRDPSLKVRGLVFVIPLCQAINESLNYLLMSHSGTCLNLCFETTRASI